MGKLFIDYRLPIEEILTENRKHKRANNLTTLITPKALTTAYLTNRGLFIITKLPSIINPLWISSVGVVY
jgi:hypothetical protein